MYQSKINIKHGCLSHLFWGKSKTAGEYIHISAVPSNGLGCNCRCPVCGGDFIACLGEKNRPHFKHQSKYKCMYTDEITTYLRSENILKAANQIALPSIAVKFGSRVLSTQAVNAVISDIYYHCDAEQYPPLLIAVLDGRPTRIILAFDGYYDNADIDMFRTEATQHCWDCLFIKLPKIDEDDYITEEILQNAFHADMNRKIWIHSTLESYWKQQLNDATIIPKTVSSDSNGRAFDCPLHVNLHNGHYFAYLKDCKACPYYFGANYECRCSAPAGIKQLSDFYLSKDIRIQKVAEERKENEEKVAKKERLKKEEMLQAERAKESQKKQAQQRMINFYAAKLCPKCKKALHKMPGKKGINWLCLTDKCHFTAFENYETGEIIIDGMD